VHVVDALQNPIDENSVYALCQRQISLDIIQYYATGNTTNACATLLLTKIDKLPKYLSLFFPHNDAM
jgi:hypothetical protein